MHIKERFSVTAVRLSAFVGLAVVWLTVTMAHADSWTQEPPLKIRLTIGEVTHEIESGRSSTIAIEGREHSVTIVPAGYRRFDKSGVRFDYPASFRFRSERLNPQAVHYCVLDGDGASIHVKEHAPKMDFDEFVNYMRGRYKGVPKNFVFVDERKVVLKTRGNDLEGVSFQIAGNIAGQKVVQSSRCFLLPTGNKETCILLIVQWQGDELSKDAVLSLSALENSLTFEGSESPVEEER